MSQIVFTFPLDTINEMKDYYKKYMSEQQPPGAFFRARTNGTVITAYKSGKVLFQGSNPIKEASKWQASTAPKEENNKAKQSSFMPPSSLFTASHIGSDESGTGDYFGPVTTCAAYVQKNQIETLKMLGIQDSKRVTDENVIQLAKRLSELNIPYSLLVLHNEKYNQLQKDGWSQGKIKAMLHHHAIKKLLSKINDFSYKGILIDQFCDPKLYINYIESEDEKLIEHSYFMTKAEHSSIAVASASIIARARFLQEIDQLSKSIGYTLQKGASKKVDKLIARIIKEKGEATLKTCAKLHFANTKKGKQLIN